MKFQGFCFENNYTICGKQTIDCAISIILYDVQIVPKTARTEVWQQGSSVVCWNPAGGSKRQLGHISLVFKQNRAWESVGDISKPHITESLGPWQAIIVLQVRNCWYKQLFYSHIAYREVKAAYVIEHWWDDGSHFMQLLGQLQQEKKNRFPWRAGCLPGQINAGVWQLEVVTSSPVPSALIITVC